MSRLIIPHETSNKAVKNSLQTKYNWTIKVITMWKKNHKIFIYWYFKTESVFNSRYKTKCFKKFILHQAKKTFVVFSMMFTHEWRTRKRGQYKIISFITGRRKTSCVNPGWLYRRLKWYWYERPQSIASVRESVKRESEDTHEGLTLSYFFKSYNLKWETHSMRERNKELPGEYGLTLLTHWSPYINCWAFVRRELMLVILRV